MSFEIIKGDQRATTFRDWKPWLQATGDLYGRYTKEIEFSPFDANEQTAVGVFAVGAATAGYLPLIEYSLRKRTRKDLRSKKDGRADLWIDCGKRSYSFEFKRSWYSATIKNLRQVHNIVKEDVSEIPTDEYYAAAAVSIAYVRDEHRLKTYRAFCEQDDIDYCFRFGPEAEGGAFLFLTLEAQKCSKKS